MSEKKIDSSLLDGARKDWEQPKLVFIGDAEQVILGIAGSGDDFLGYSPPQFEFEPDGGADS